MPRGSKGFIKQAFSISPRFARLTLSLMKNPFDIPFVYRLFTKLIGGNKVRLFFVEQFVAPKQGWRVLDMGCGTGELLDYLPPFVEYVGIDHNERYLNAAQKFGPSATFMCCKIDKGLIGQFRDCDAVLAFGLIHHLNDNDALTLFQIAQRSLKPEGKFVTLDGCFHHSNTMFARFLLRSDRGKHIRDENGYVSLAKKSFRYVEVSYKTGKARIPYTALTMVCTSPYPLTEEV